jgi:hypothetical protein
MLSPRKWAISIMDSLATDARIELATARAEVEFREKERCAEWRQHPLDTSMWKLGEPMAPLPAYWGAAVEYAATVILAHARVAADATGEEAMGPAVFERFLTHCPRIVAETTYARKLNRYACVRLRSLDLVIGKLSRDAEQQIAAEIKSLEDGVWKRHRDAICGTTSAERSAIPETCDGQGASSVTAGNSSAGSAGEADRGSPGEYFEAYRAKHPTVTYDQIAARIGFSRDSLYKIKDETAWVREHAYAATAGLLGCRPEDLHPRNLPRFPRRKRRPTKSPA